MKYLKGILSESDMYYSGVEKRIRRRIAGLPEGSVKKRRISSRIYWYLQKRAGNKVVHKYLGKDKPSALMGRIKEREMLKKELKSVKESRKILKRAKAKKK